MAVVNLLLPAFGVAWAENGTVEAIDEAQWRAGWAFIGSTPPSVEQFNKLAQVQDQKANWLYQQMLTVMTAAGLTPTAGTAVELLQAMRQFAAQGGFPGQIAYAAQVAPPAGWVKCNGAALSRTDFAALFAAIGTTYGPGNGTTTFNVPELRGEFVRTLDDGRGADAGRTLGSIQKATVVGGYDDNNTDNNTSILGNKGTTDYGSDPINSGDYPGAWPVYTTGAGAGSVALSTTFFSATRPRNIALPAFIKF